MENKPTSKEIARYMKEDFLYFIKEQDMPKGEAFSRLLEEFEGVINLGKDFEKTVLIIGMAIAIENGISIDALEKRLASLF